MTSTDDKPLNLVQAARLIYRTPQPTPEQVYRVLARMKGGVLKGTRAGKAGWTTTTEFVAEYLARQSVHRHGSRQEGSAGRWGDDVHLPPSPVLSAEHSRTLRSAYGEMLKEYFLAVLLRRKRHHRSKVFQRFVVVTQIALVAFIYWLAATAVKLGGTSTAPERQVVEQWIAENAGGRFQILEWHPSEPTKQGLIVPVDYRYFRNGAKPVETSRTFLVAGDEVKLLDNE